MAYKQRKERVKKVNACDTIEDLSLVYCKNDTNKLSVAHLFASKSNTVRKFIVYSSGLVRRNM